LANEGDGGRQGNKGDILIRVFTVPGWDKYNPRADVKSCSWFRMSNDFFSDPEFYGLSVEARIIWIFILSTASKKMSSTVKINLKMVSDMTRLSLGSVEVAINELLLTGSLNEIGDNVISARSNPIVLPMLPSATNERTDEQTNTESSSRLSAFTPKKWLNSSRIIGEEIASVANGFFEKSEKQEVDEEGAPELAIKVLTALNTICFTNFRPSKSSLKHINGRIKEGYTYEDFVEVIKNRNELWANNPKMSEYLRPKTLFNSDNFDGYLQAAKNADKEQIDPLEQFLLDSGITPGMWKGEPA
jgi:uncharacterized phage protein (TIGR02220 family)